MKFFIKKIVLWSLNGMIRELEFLPNKVNVITGDSNTGKTAILDIFDYCLFSSDPKISEGVINENVSWYGLVININDKEYTLARGRIEKHMPSQDYYFSSIGEIPGVIEKNISEDSLKAILETEFSIDRKVAVPYGSNIISAGSKISLRYFLMFNTISGNIIENDQGIFFDKQNNARYRDALPRIFDLAVGIETVENILKKEKKEELEKKLKSLEKRSLRLSKKEDEFKKDKDEIVLRAKELSIVDEWLDVDDSIDFLKNLLELSVDNQSGKDNRANLEKEYSLLQRKIKNIQRFSQEYTTYKKNIANIEDSLKPINYLKSLDSDLVKTSIFDDLLSSFESDLREIKKAKRNKTPVDNQMNDVIRELEKRLEVIKDKLSVIPDKNKSFKTIQDKYMFLGEIKAKLDIFSDDNNSLLTNNNGEMEKLQKKLSEIIVANTDEHKELAIKLVEEIIDDYIVLTGSALENYAKYKPVFDYKNKALLLRRPKSSLIENIGSSSNHMFMHLFFTLAMHEVAFENSSRFVAPFLIIDQPSRPYYGDSDKQKSSILHSDEYKISVAFKLLNDFISDRITNEGEFQMIVFEHIPKKVFNDMKNVHLVEEFMDGNALIKSDFISH